MQKRNDIFKKEVNSRRNNDNKHKRYPILKILLTISSGKSKTVSTISSISM